MEKRKQKSLTIILLCILLGALAAISSCGGEEPAPRPTPVPQIATPLPSPNTPPIPPDQETFQMSEEESLILIFKRLQHLAVSVESKEFIALILTDMTGHSDYEEKLGGWQFIFELNIGEIIDVLEVAPWFVGDASHYCDLLDEMSWFVYDSGEVMPINRGALLIEAGIEQLNRTGKLMAVTQTTKETTDPIRQSVSKAQGFNETNITATQTESVSEAFKVETNLAPISFKSPTYPELKMLGLKSDPDLFHETVPREQLENRAWDPKELEAKVSQLVYEYEKANPYVDPYHVCRHMAVEFWHILEDNGVTSLIVLGNTTDQGEWRITFGCDHLWIVVLGTDNLNLAVECTNGKVYSSSNLDYCWTELERTKQEYGEGSYQYKRAKTSYNWIYVTYEQHLEGYFFKSPLAYNGSQLLSLFPWNW